MKVTITGYSEDGTCGFCRREGKEGVTCSFEDGSYSGFRPGSTQGNTLQSKVSATLTASHNFAAP